MSKPQSFIAVAGATGQLGELIALNIREKTVDVKALVRPGTSPARTQKLRDAGVTIAEVDLNDVLALTTELQGARTFVSALQGLRDVIQGVQGAILEACIAAKVPRYIPSDYSLDFTKTRPGSNRNLDLRREFHEKLDASGIAWTSVLNGAFMELFTGGQVPIISDGIFGHRITHFGSPDQKLDATTIPDVARYTALVAADTRPTPKILRIAGDSFSAKDLAKKVSTLRGVTYTPMWTGSVGFLRGLIVVLKFLIGGTEDVLLPPWQGMQYLENMVSGVGKLDPLDNDRYPGLQWTSVEESLRAVDAEKAKKKTN